MKSILLLNFALILSLFSQEEQAGVYLRPTFEAIQAKADLARQRKIGDSLKTQDGVFLIESTSSILAGPGSRLKMVNCTDEPLYFYGTSIDTPRYRLELLKEEGESREPTLWWCGTGVRLIRLEAGHFCEFSVITTESEYRVGLNVFADKEDLESTNTVVWSKKIIRKG